VGPGRRERAYYIIAQYLAGYAARRRASDRRLLDRPEVRRQLAHLMAEGYRQGGAAGVEAALTEVRPWGVQVDVVQ